VQDTIFRDLEQCWLGATGGGRATWELTLPVIDCPRNAISNCATLLTAVTVKVVWVQRDNPGYRNAPMEMHHTEKGIDWPSATDLSERVGDLQDYFVGSTSSDLFPVHLSDLRVGDVFNQGTEDAGRVRWASFVKTFDLRNVGSSTSAPYATLAQKSIYFLPSCTPHPPVGDTGGPNTGILAKIPKLVE
jgi:hypothetical protein